MRKVEYSECKNFIARPARVVWAVAEHDGKRSICPLGWKMTTSNSPPMIAISVAPTRFTHDLILNSGGFVLAWPGEDLAEATIFCGTNSGRDVDKFKDTDYKTGVNGAPIVLENAIGYLEVEVIDSMDIGTHTVFVGKVVNEDVVSVEEPMTYAFYHQVKKGKTPKSAPTYIENKKETEVSKVDKYVCTICGYVYDPAEGDPDSDIQPGTAFDDLPDDWVCPVCGADKSAFEKE